MYKIQPIVKHVDFKVMTNEEKIKRGIFLPIDQMPVKDFNLNDFGRPRNVVSQLAHCASLEEYNAIARNLQKNPAQYGLPDKYSVKDVFATLKPRSCQMPTELEDFALALQPYDQQRLNEAYKQVSQKQLFEAEKSAEDASVTSVSE